MGTAELLLELGSDIAAVDDTGGSAFDVAHGRGFKALAGFLHSEGGGGGSGDGSGAGGESGVVG
jgi:hypothetical protein